MNKNNFYTVKGYQLKEQNLLTSSMEDHLEMIYRLIKEKNVQYVRVNQLAKNLNLRPSSTSKIIQKLTSVGLINYQPYGIIELTSNGEKWGDFLLTRHKVIQTFLKSIGVQKSLLKDTEMIEHYIGIESLECIEIFNKFFEDNKDIIYRYNKYKNTLLKNNK